MPMITKNSMAWVMLKTKILLGESTLAKLREQIAEEILEMKSSKKKSLLQR